IRENSPYGLGRAKLIELLFPSPHPYHNGVYGKSDDVNAATLTDAKVFYEEFYAPNNATLVLVGDFEPGTAKRLVAKCFGSLRTASTRRSVSPVGRPEIADAQVKRATLSDRVTLPRITFAWLAGQPYQQGHAELELLTMILSHGKLSYLQRE